MISEFMYYRGTEMQYSYEVDKDAERYTLGYFLIFKGSVTWGGGAGGPPPLF